MIITILLISLFIIFLYIFGSMKSVSDEIKLGEKFKTNSKFIKKFNPKVGEEVNFWYDDRNGVINIYLKGTAGGQGKIGVLHEKHFIKRFDDDTLEAKISFVSDEFIYLKFT